MNNVFDALKTISQRPYMYLGGDSETSRFELLRRLELLLFGYGLAVRIHNTPEPVSDFCRGFSDWLRVNYKWDLSNGVTAAFRQHVSAPEEAWQLFWRLVNEYQQHLGA